jgi:fibronectin-binding autotransporter adhesin
MNRTPSRSVSSLLRASQKLILLGGIASLCGTPLATAADALFTSGAFTGDADSGVSTAKTYVTAANILGGNVVVNGVTFTGSVNAVAGFGWDLAGTNDQVTGVGNHTTTFGGSVIDDLFADFRYGGNPATLTLSELTVGRTYSVTLYNQTWSAAPPRVNFIASTEGASTLYDQDVLEASTLRYTFVATGATTALTFTPKSAASFHFYGLSTEQVFNKSYTATGGGSWNNAVNWSTGVPNGVGSNASFAAQAAPATVTLDAPITVGHVEFLGNQSYTVSGPNLLTLQGDTGGASVLKADVGSTHTISTAVQLNSRLAKFGEGTIRLTGAVTGSGKGATISSGKLEIASTTSDLTSIGNVAINGTLAIENPNAQRIGSNITGTGGLEKRGAGVLTIGGYQEYGGATVIREGTLKLDPTTAVPIGNSSFESYTAPLANGSFAYTPGGATWTFASAGIALNGSPWFVPTNHDGAAAGFIQGGSISQSVTVATAGFYNLNFQGVSRGFGNGPSGLLLKIDGTTVRELDPTEFSDATWQTYNVGVSLLPGNHSIEFVGKNVLGGDRSTVIDAVNLSTGGRLPSNSAVQLVNSGATLDLTGVAQTIGSLAGGAGTSVLDETSLTAGGNNSSTLFAGSISGAGSFTKTGTGTLQLSGNNTYGGATTITGGTVQLTGGTLPANTALTFSATGTTLITNGTPLTVSTLSGPAGSTLNVGSGALTVGSPTSSTFDGALTSGPLTKVGTGRLITNGPLAVSGALTVSAGTLKFGTASNTGTLAAADIATGSTWDLGLGNQSATGLTGTGTITRTGTLTTGANGAALISPAKNYALKLDFGNNAGASVNGVQFDTAGTSGTGFALTGAGTIFNETAVLAGYDQLVDDFYYNGNLATLTFNSLTPAQTYEAVLYTKVGHWANRFQNTTFDEDGAGPAGEALVNVDPGTLGYYAYRFVAHGTSMSVSMAAVVPGTTFHWFAASLENVAAVAPTLTIGDAGNYAFNGTINGPTKLIKQGTGTQELFGASNYSGGTSINAGALMGHDASALGTGPVSIAAGANFLPWWKTGSSVMTNAFTLNGVGGAFPGGEKAAIYADGGPVNGFAEYTLAGTITLAATSNLGGNVSNNLRVTGAITGPGGLIKGGGRADENNTLILGNTANDYAGNTSITKGTVKLAASEVIPHGAGKGGVIVNAGTTLDLGGFSETINSLSGAGVITSTAAAGVAVFFTNDAGTGISSTKTYTHALDFAEATPVSINSVNFTGAGGSGANWSLTGAVLTAGSGTTGATGDISRLLTNFYYNGNPATLTLTGLTPGVTYESRLYHRNWGGNRNQLFTITSGSGSGTTIFNSDATTVPSYLPFRYTAGATGEATITTAQVGDGTYHWYGMTNEVVSSPVLTVGDASDSTYGGNITGPLGLAKAGAGALTLTATADFSGPTTVNGGTLRVNGSLSGTSALSVNGGILAGTGSINPAADITVAAGGAIAPGASIGTLSTGDVTLSNGSALSIEIGALTSDQLQIAGAATLIGTISLNLSLLADPIDSTKFTILNGTSALVGYGTGARFDYGGNLLDQGEIFLVSGAFNQTFQIDYAADGGNDVTLLAVPEPGSALLLVFGATALASRRRRKA